MRRLTSPKHTRTACYIGYITQAIVNNFAALLFVMFHTGYGIPLERLGLLVTVNFVIQLLVDLAAAKFVDRIGYRIPAVAAHVFAAAGLIALAILPDLAPTPYVGILIAVVIYGIGGGLTEVLISPIAEACPGDGKAGAMSILHSFYCWGSVAVVALSTLFLHWFGMESWRTVACLWAIVPIFNIFYFSVVPIYPLTAEGEGMSIPALLRSRVFLVMALLMLCAGASELSMSQWASAFAESGLSVSKTVGDLAGPCFFALLMGSARIFHAKFGEKIPLTRYLGACSVLCIASYLLASFSPIPVLSLLGCGICGISVAAMWPGVFSLASETCPTGGTAMFALLALAGDSGCALGPYVVGLVSETLGNNIKAGILCAAVFPALLLLGLALLSASLRRARR